MDLFKLSQNSVGYFKILTGFEAKTILAYHVPSIDVRIIYISIDFKKKPTWGRISAEEKFDFRVSDQILFVSNLITLRHFFCCFALLKVEQAIEFSSIRTGSSRSYPLVNIKIW